MIVGTRVVGWALAEGAEGPVQGLQGVSATADSPGRVRPA